MQIHSSKLLILSLLTLVLVLAAPVPAADAGTYVVSSCQGSGPAGDAWVPSASAGLVAGDFCPIDNNRPADSGLIDRVAVSGNPSLPGLSAASHRFDAPAGDSIDSISFSAGFWVGADPNTTGWRAGLWGIGADGSVIKRWGDCSYGQCTGAVYSVGGPQTVQMAGARAASLGVLCVQSSCPASATTDQGQTYPRAWFNAGDIRVTVRDDTRPELSARDSAWQDGWHRGSQTLAIDAADNSGVAATALDIDGVERSHHLVACRFDHARPCPTGVGPEVFAFDSTALSDGTHQVGARAIDAAQNASTISHTIGVDNHAPAPPAGLAVAGGDGWRHGAGFGLSWTNPDGQTAPISAAHWTACRAEDEKQCTSGTARGDQISAIDGLAVSAPGDWIVRVGLEDAAGNFDPTAVSDPVHVRFDPSGPDQLGFLERDAGDPRRIEAVLGDAVSGPAGGRIELRKTGEDGGWTQLATTFAGGHLVAHVDDEAMPAGVYRGRVTGSDVAGNERTTDRYADDQSGGFLVTLPARTPTRISVALQASSATYVPFASKRPVRGTLTSAEGRPVGDALVEVRARSFSPLGTERQVDVLETDRDGDFAYTAPAGPSRELRFYYHGSPVLGPAFARQKLLVRAAVTLKVSRRRVRNRHSVLFTGLLRGGPVPPQGKLINLQAFYRRKWRTFATARTTSRGSFRSRYRFEATYGRVVYRFRAMARREAAYPYELGVSRSVAVTVTGPKP